MTEEMSTERAEVMAMLQPYIDGELSSEDSERFASTLEDSAELSQMVQEQCWVRNTLNSVDRDSAPQSLRARVLLALDEEDRATALDEAKRSPSLLTRLKARFGQVGRRGLMMVPAGALAVAVFIMAKDGNLPGAVEGTQGSLQAEMPDGDAALLQQLASMEPALGFPVQHANPDASATRGVRLVSASFREPTLDRPAAASMTYRVRASHGRTMQVLDVQSRVPSETGASRISGSDMTTRSFEGKTYTVNRNAARVVVSFVEQGVLHELSFDMHDDTQRAARAANVKVTDAAAQQESDYEDLIRLGSILRKNALR
jgi:hypothetical protein